MGNLWMKRQSRPKFNLVNQFHNTHVIQYFSSIIHTQQKKSLACKVLVTKNFFYLVCLIDLLSNRFDILHKLFGFLVKYCF